MRTVEVRSNIAGDIMKIRKGVVFKEHATVIDELLQNCQRAQATKVDVTCEGRVLRISDDGAGCSDPQSLFEKNTSAWAEEDEAFGEGFFSVFLLADKLRARSHDWELTLDILDMLETKNMEIAVETDLPMVSGFTVELEGDLIERKGYELREEVRTLGRIMPATVTLNAGELDQFPLLTVMEDREQLIETSLFSAVLQPASGWGGLDYFYENRPVRNDYMTGVRGRVAIAKGQITLKAPDRKEFIYDDKRKDLMNGLKEAIRSMYLEFVKTATDAELDSYAEGIETYLKVEEYADLLGVSAELFKGKKTKEEHSPEVPQEELDTAVPKWVERSLPQGVLAVLNDVVRTSRPKGSLKTLTKASRLLVYVPAGKVDEYTREIREAEYSGFTVVYAKNRLYNSALEFFGVRSIAELHDHVKEVHVADNDVARSKKEQRFLALMSRVEQHYAMKPGSIRLANLRAEMRLTDTDEVLPREDMTVQGMCDRGNGLVYIDRSVVKFPEYRAQVPEYPSVTAHDYRVLLRVTQVLAHELAHLLYGFSDNTMEHSQAMVRIGAELAELF